MPQLLVEQVTLTEAQATAAKETGRFPIQFISPGWGSSGYYSPQVLEQAATDKVIPAGTHMYADHPTDIEAMERPGRSIRDLMAVTVEDAHLSSDGALVGEVQVVPAWQDLIEAVRDHIGVSIRGSATDIVEGEAEGRKGPVIEGLVAPVTSVDFVTRAGRGGKVLRVLESAAANRRAIKHGIDEATVNDDREALQTQLRDAYGADKTYVWVRDFDDTTVWFEVESGDDAGIFGQPYARNRDGAVALSGERAEVRTVTTYVPATRSDSTTTTESQRRTFMGTIQIEETEHRSLVEKAGRVDTLETERDTAQQERDAARTEASQLRAQEAARSHARTRVTEANAQLAASTVDRIVAQATATVPLTEAGELDTAALDTAVDTARTAEETYLAGLLAESGVGRISGFGGTSTGAGEVIEEADIDKAVGSAWGRTAKEA